MADPEIRTTSGGDERTVTDGSVRITTANLDSIVPILDGLNSTNPRIIFDAPPQLVLNAIKRSRIATVRFCDIYEADTVTPFHLNVPITDGNITVDSARDERRIIDLEIVNKDLFSVGSDPNELWYDKIIKPYRGITVGGTDYVTQLGEFMIDRVSEPHFPAKVTVSGRDKSKKMLQSKLSDTTVFSPATSIEAIVEAMALNSGVLPNKIALPVTGSQVGNISPFDRLTPRWTVAKTVTESAGYELYFDRFGVLTMRPFVDPVTAPTSHTFKTGVEGNIVDFELSVEDTDIFNEVVVHGTGNSNQTIVGSATNTDSNSPTRISRLGRRTMEFGSATVRTIAEANALASKILKVAALEQYDAAMTSIATPWLEVGEAVKFDNPKGSSSDPIQFLLANFTVPLGLEPMTSALKRIHVVG